MSQYTNPGQEFGQQMILPTGSRRYLVLHSNSTSTSTTTSSKQGPTQPKSASGPAPPSFAEKPISLEDFTALDSAGNERTSIHGIPIAKNPSTKNYSLLYTFPALLGPSLTQKVPIPLPAPTKGGSIQLLISNPSLEELLKQYKAYFDILHEARLAQPYTHFFGIPLGPVNPLCYDLTETSKKQTVTKAAHFTEERNKSDVRFSGTKFMSSETSWNLARNVSAVFERVGVDTRDLLESVPQKHDNYKGIGAQGQSVSPGVENQDSGKYDPQTASEQELVSHSIMPLPKLHITLFCLRILSRDEFDLITNQLQSVQKVLYDAIGGTSISVAVKKCTGWGLVPSKDKGNSTAQPESPPTSSAIDYSSKQLCKHFVAQMAEVAKDGKTNASHHIPTIAPDDSEYAPSDQDNGRAFHELPKQQFCPRIALLTGLIVHTLRKIGIISMSEIKKERLGTETGQYCAVNWHMTLLNSKYANKPRYMLPLDALTKAEKVVKDWGVHRIPCINLYRMGSALHFNSKYPTDPALVKFSQWLPARHTIKDHYVIDYTIPMP